MPKARTIKKQNKLVAPSVPKSSDDSKTQIMAQSSFGDKEFTKAYAECASGEIADSYRSYTLDDCEYNVPSGIIKDRSALFMKNLRRDEIARKILDLPVIDSLSNWRDSNYKWEKELNVVKVVQDAMKFARRFGVSAILPIIRTRDGNIVPANRPLENVIAEFGSNLTVDKLIHSTVNLTFEGEIELDFYKPWFGFPKKMKIGERQVHPSRIALFGNLLEPTLISILGDLADYHEARRRLAISVRRNSGLILSSDFGKISNFLTAKKRMSGAAPSLEEITQERARSLYQNVNDVNVAVINKDEKVDQYEQSNIKELVGNVELQMQILSAVGDIPLSKLFQVQASGGLSNKSETEFLNYSQSLVAFRSNDVEEPLMALDHIMSEATGEKTTDWLWNPTRAEELWLKLSQKEQQPAVPDEGGSE